MLISYFLQPYTGFQVAQQERIDLPMQAAQRQELGPCSKKAPWSRKRQPTAVFLPEKSHA